MKLSILMCLAVAFVASAEPWQPRPGRGSFKRDAAPEGDAFHVRPGTPIYTYVAKRDAEPEPEAEAFHKRPGDPIYTYVAKRDAKPEPEAEADPWRPRPGRGSY